MSTGQTLLEGFFQATGRKRPNSGSIPISKRTKDVSLNPSPKKVILSTDFVSLHPQQKQATKQKQVTARTAKPAPARKPRGSKKLMQTSVCPPEHKTNQKNKAKNETFIQLQDSLSRSKSPLKPSTPLSSGLKALTATKQEVPPSLAQTPKSPGVSSPSYQTPVILKIPNTTNSNLEQVGRVRRRLLTQLDEKESYKVPPLPARSARVSKLSLAKQLAQPTPVEAKARKTLLDSPVKSLPFENKDERCLSPKRDSIIRKLALLKTPEKSPKMKTFRELQFSSPTKTPTSPIQSPPHYQKYHHLSTDSQMPISHTHSILLEHFRCMDVVLSMTERRRETCPFEKLQRAVSTMSGKQLSFKQVAQILFLYPFSFSLSYQPVRTSINSPRRGQQQLIITANNDLHCESPTRSVKSKSLTNQDLLTRNKQMRAHVIQFLMGYHDKFLRSFDPPIKLPSDQIKRWHPSFNLDTVPGIPEGKLPQKPHSNTPQMARQVLESSHDLLPTRISKVMQRLMDEKSAADPGTESTDTPSDTKQSIELKGVSKNLIERIRLKEQEKAKLNMVRDDGVIQKLEMLEKLPEICSIVRNMYLAEKRGTLPWSDVLYKLKESHHCKMDQKLLEEHLTLLLETLPNWASSVKLKNTKFLKVKRNTPLNTLLSDLECEKSRLES